MARLEAIDAAEYLGAGAKAILPDLIGALDDNTPIRTGDKTPVRLRAAVALGKMGPAAKEAVPKLSNMLKESDPALKRAALEALGQIGSAATFALPRLREMIRTEPAFAEQAQQVLDRIESK
jgi:HEAT repeat protein